MDSPMDKVTKTKHLTWTQPLVDHPGNPIPAHRAGTGRGGGDAASVEQGGAAAGHAYSHAYVPAVDGGGLTQCEPCCAGGVPSVSLT
jgi:hypothetical protein